MASPARRSSRGAGPCPARTGPRRAVRRARASGRGETRLAERRSMLEKARQAERLTAERTPPRSGTTGTARRSRSRPSSRRWPRPTRRRTRCRSSARAVERLRVARRSDPRAHGRPVGRGRGPVRGRARADLATAVALVDRARAGRHPVAAGRSWLETLGIVDLGVVAAVPSAGSSPASGSSSRSSPSGCAAATGCRASCATSRSTGGCAVAPRWRPS